MAIALYLLLIVSLALSIVKNVKGFLKDVRYNKRMRRILALMEKWGYFCDEQKGDTKETAGK